MRKLILILLLLMPMFILAQSTYYVATDGNDNNNGTIEQPFATWQRGFIAITSPGDTLFIRGGTYMNKMPIYYNPFQHPAIGVPAGVSGTKEMPVVIMSYPNEWAILDCTLHCDNIPWRPTGGKYNGGIGINYTEHLILKNFEIKNVFQCDSTVSGAIGASYSCNLTFEHIIMHDIGQRGFAISGGVWGPTDGRDPKVPIEPSMWGFNHPDTTRFINCDVYNLCDTLSSEPGNAADAWKTIHYAGNHLEWIGCRAWNYTDDGFDPNGGTRYFENCWAMAGDKYKGSISDNWEVERNGFKVSGPALGYSEDIVFTKFKNCIAYDCNHGIILMENYDYNRLNAQLYNNLLLKCGIGIANWSDGRPDVRSLNEYKNNIIYGTTQNTAAGPRFPYHTFILSNVPYDVSHCTWKWAPSEWSVDNQTFQNSTDNLDYNPTDADWVSLDHETVFAQLTASRKADGSLPNIPALQLTRNSSFIDGGIDVGLPYIGSAPDLGPFEYIDDIQTKISSKKYDGFSVISYSPNPTKDNINIQITNNSTSNINISVINLLGQTILYKTYLTNVGVNDLILDLATIRSGNYIISLNNNGMIINLMILKR